MSIRIMSKVWGLELKPASKLILLALADNANEDGICWPGITYIERKTGLARSTVIKYINDMVDAGYITKQSQYSKNGFRATNLYQFNLQRPMSDSRTSLSPRDGLPLVRELDLPSPTHGPKSSYNHHKEPIRQVEQAQPVSVSQDVIEIFTYWQTKLNHPKAKLDGKRKRKINNALKLKYSLDDLKRAIDGCSKSKYHQGNNEGGVKYDSVELIFRDAEHIEKFMELSQQPMYKTPLALDE